MIVEKADPTEREEQGEKENLRSKDIVMDDESEQLSDREVGSDDQIESLEGTQVGDCDEQKEEDSKVQENVSEKDDEMRSNGEDEESSIDPEVGPFICKFCKVNTYYL